MRAIVDAGPLVALLDRAEQRHAWVRERLAELQRPLLICEAVLSETLHIVRRHDGWGVLFNFIESGALRFAFGMEDELPALRGLHERYADQPMSLADACIVRMAEIFNDHAVLTLDSDFFVYRKHGRVPLTLIHPAIQ
jgi:predicted nucleic acid-binding protein